jgi:uncharacterized glyoxalase superfamily protein PhnB
MALLTPYLTVRDARAAVSWYADALGAHLVGEPYVADDDRIGHAELALGGATLYLADEYPELGLAGPDDGRVSVSLVLPVPDVDAAVDRAAAAGATVERPPSDGPGGRTGVVLDPFGHRWMLQTPSSAAATPRPPVRPGDALSLTLQVPDGARARDFYESVLDWSATPDGGADGWRVDGAVPAVGITGGSAEPGSVPVYAVDDIEVAVAAVRTAGGQADEVASGPSGRTVECRDDQGLLFRLAQLD